MTASVLSVEEVLDIQKRLEDASVRLTRIEKSLSRAIRRRKRSLPEENDSLYSSAQACILIAKGKL